MTKYEMIAEKIAVTFIEAAGAYLIVIPTVNWNKTIIAGAIGAGLSAAYNLVRESQPTIPSPTTPPSPEIVPPPADPVITT